MCSYFTLDTPKCMPKHCNMSIYKKLKFAKVHPECLETNPFLILASTVFLDVHLPPVSNLIMSMFSWFFPNIVMSCQIYLLVSQAQLSKTVSRFGWSAFYSRGKMYFDCRTKFLDEHAIYSRGYCYSPFMCSRYCPAYLFIYLCIFDWQITIDRSLCNYWLYTLSGQTPRGSLKALT